MIADNRTCRQHGMAQAQGFALTYHRHGHIVREPVQAVRKRRFTFMAQLGIQLSIDIKIVFNRTFLRMTHQHNVFDTCRYRLCDHVMNGWTIAKRQQLFRNSFGQWQHACPKSCHWNNGMGNFFHHHQALFDCTKWVYQSPHQLYMSSHGPNQDTGFHCFK